jgi:hypothetical protein
MSGWDYDNAPTDPRHGGKLTAAKAVERLKELEDALRDLAMLERTQAPDMGGKRRRYAFMQNGSVLAECLDRARDLLGMEPR